MKLWTIKEPNGRRLLRAHSSITNCGGYSFEYEGDGPTLRFMVPGNDGKKYAIALNRADINAIIKWRQETYAEYFDSPRLK